MKTPKKLAATALAVVLALTILGPLVGVASAADAGACYAIADADARHYCRAKAHRDTAICYSIMAPGLRSICLAEVRK